jgi:Na+/proline symporter
MSAIMSTPDWIVLIAYLVIVIIIGFLAGRKIRSTDGYFLGGRKFGKLLMIGQSFGTGTHGDMPVSLAGAVYSGGLSAIWFQWKNMFVTPFYWLLAPLFRRFRRTTVAEVVQDRYGPWMGTVYTVFALLFFTLNLASLMKGGGKVISESLNSSISSDVIIAGMAVAFILYSFTGGLLASAWNDFLQGFLIIILSFLLLPLGWELVGGLGGMKETLGTDFFSLATPGKIGLGFILVLTLNGLIGIVAQPQMIAAVGTGKDEMTCRVGHLYGTMLKRICTVGWALVGLMVACFLAKGVFGTTQLSDPEEAFGFACRNLLFPGGIGLLIACFLAANMSSCSAFMVSAGALFTNGIYRKVSRTEKPDSHYLLIGRLSGLFITVLSAVYAVYFIDRVLYSFLLTETLSTYFGVSLFAGIVWRRANRWGALASVLSAMIANFAAHLYQGERLDHWSPGVFLFSLGIGVAALIVVSLLTPAEDERTTRQFFWNLETPSDSPPGIELTSRDAAAQGRQLLLPHLFRLREGAAGYGFWHAYRRDLVGFAAGWLVVLALLFTVWILLAK